MIINLKTESQRVNRKPQSYKTKINILRFPGLAQTGTEQLGQGATLLGWPKSIYYADKNLKSLETIVNCELFKVVDWLIANKLSLNIKKTNYIMFHPYQKR